MGGRKGPAAAREPEREREQRTVPKPPPTFSFVTITNPDEWKSKNTAVRSHVAYYQHHKDDEKEDGATPPSGSSSRRSMKRAGKSGGLLARLPTFSSESSTSTSTSTSVSVSSDRINFQILKKEHQVPLSGWEFDATGNGYGSSPIMPTFSGTRSDMFQSYPVPWNSQVYDPILDFYLTYILVDTPSLEQDGEIYRLKSSFFPFIMKSPTTFYAAMAFAGSIYHFRKKLSLDAPSLLDLRHKAILGINESLSKSTELERSPDDQTIGAVFCMSLLESMYGDTSSYHIHMRGLQRMVQMRRGLDRLGLEGLLAKMIVWLDFNHAKVHETNLFFGESAEASKRQSPFKHPKDPGIDTGGTKILR